MLTGHQVYKRLCYSKYMKFIQINQENKNAILELFGKTVDNEGFIIEKMTGKRLICPYSEEIIKVDNFSILPGSATFVNNKSFCFAEHMVSHLGV